MFLSQKGSLGRNPMINRVGQRLLQLFEGASAAYSLRDLASNIASVVRVRRASDNSEKDFSATDVSSGAMTQWVNAQVVPPLDVRELVDGERTGDLVEAAAAYSLRNLSASGTSLTTVGDTQTDYFSFTGATGDTAALNGIQYEYGFPYNGAKGYNSAPPAPEDSQMIRDENGRWLLFRASSNPQGPKTYALSAIGSTEYPWEADWTGSELENAVFTQQRTGDYVVQVRRSSDSTIRSFTAAEVANGTLTNWVNTSLADALPLDTASGAAAAYSLRNLSTSYTGNVVDVRRSSDDAEDSFTAAEVADGTLTDWVNTNFNVKTYDFSSGTGGLGLPSNITLEGDESIAGVDDALKISVVSTGSNTVHRCYQNLTPLGSGSSLRITLKAYRPSSNVNSGKLGFSFASGFLGANVGQQFFSADDTWEDFSFDSVSGNSTRFYLQLSATNGSGSLKSNFNGTTGDHVYIKDLKIDVVNSSGHVTQWYDQTAEAADPENITGFTVSDGTYITSYTQIADINGKVAFQSGANETIRWDTEFNTWRLRIDDAAEITYTSSEDTTYPWDVTSWTGSSGTPVFSSFVGGSPVATGNHATQGTDANQPKIVDAGTLVSGGLDFDGVDDFLPVPLTGHNIGNLSSFCVGKFDNASGNSDVMLSLGTGAGDSRWYGPWANTSNIRYGYGSTSDAIAEFAASTDVKVHTLIAGTTIGNASGFENGTLKGTATRSTATAAGTFGIGGVADATSFPLDGKVQEVIIYESDQSDKRQAIEENIGSNYGITLTSSKDGTVSTWYDQSGNANHATQGTPASQPKIVDAGSLVSGGLDFDGAQKLEKLFPSGFNGKEQSYFVKFTPNSNLGYLVELGGGIGAARSLSVEPYLRFNVVTQDYDSTILSGDSLLSMVCPDAPTTIDGYDLYYQGSLLTPDSLSGGTLANVTSSDITIGDSAYIGKISEVILYDSDQSDNRTAFEANIGETYGIDLPSGVDTGYDQVDGFVETWYDQSGNGNDAAQQVSGYQPKIVDAGVLVTDRDGKIALNGKSARLDMPSNAPMLSSDGTYSLFAAVDFDDQRNGNDAFNNIIAFTSKTDGGASDFRKPLIYAGQNNGEVRLTSPSNPFGTASLTLLETVGVQLLTNIANPALPTGSNTAYVDGVLVSSSNTSTDVNTETLTGNNNTRLFDLQETTVETFLSEVIYYPSDQSANREAIEANINNQYDIY